MALQWVFWGAIGLILYTYLLYPALLWLITVARRTSSYPEPTDHPDLSLIIAAYNEADVIAAKINNALELQYPAKVTIIVVSDGSIDDTNEIVQAYADRCEVVFLRQENAGKTVAQNTAVQKASGDLLVFSDANSMYRPDALKKLVAPFSDPEVGCVCGELRYVDSLAHGGVGKGEGFYWRYEQFLKRRESRLGSLVGANGSIYAIRLDLFEELEPEIISDFIMPIRVCRRGYRVIYEPLAVAEEESAPDFGGEYRRRRRIIARSIYGLWRERGALNPFRYPLFSFLATSHKVIRWLVPVCLLAMLFASSGPAGRGEGPYTVLFGLQLIIYGLALIGLAFPRTLGQSGLFYLPAYFCAINLGALQAIIDAMIGRRFAVWKPTARS